MKRVLFLPRCAALLLCVAVLLGLSACGEVKSSQKQVFAMDTVMTLTAYGKKADEALESAASVIYSMDAMLDPELSTSNVYAINHAYGETVVVSGQIARMLQTAQTIYERSGGALDLTIYPLVKRWGFVDSKFYVPTAEEIAEDLSRLCFDELILTSFPSTGTYTVQLPGYAQLSFGAVAKGCTASYVIDAMRNAGVESGIISLGGNVQTLGVKPDRSPWRVAITDPNDPTSWVGTIDVGETAVVTSGSYQRNFTQNGQFYHHLLKPTTGTPANNTLLSVSIVCADGTEADALSTAMFILGENAALNYWRTYGGFEMILITKDNRIVCTKGLMENFRLDNKYYELSYTE